MFFSPAGALAALNVASAASPGVGTRAELSLPPTGKPLAALAPTPSLVSHQAADIDTVGAFQNQTATAPGQHGVPLEKLATPFQRAGAASTVPVVNVTRSPTTAARGDILDYVRTQRVCFVHAFAGNCRRPGGCQWQHEPFPAAFYKDVASARRPGNPPHPVTSPR